MKEFALAFVNGFLSFSSPCILPLLPGYLSLLSGFSAKEIFEGREVDRRKLLLFSIFFILGFSTVFSSLGAFSSYTASFLVRYKFVFQKISGLILFILGLHITRVIKIGFLEYEKRRMFRPSNPGYIAAFITGTSFAFGWSPCIGPFLASILMIAANKSIVEGVMLLLVYSFGMGLGFILVSVFGGGFIKSLSSRKDVIVWIEKIAGILIMMFGALIFFDRFSLE
ncbi:MAG: cytochrome c biogenesis CcdA family protein [Elusimicrobiales bacterium]